jgi:hypothetical protein
MDRLADIGSESCDSVFLERISHDRKPLPDDALWLFRTVRSAPYLIFSGLPLQNRPCFVKGNEDLAGRDPGGRQEATVEKGQCICKNTAKLSALSCPLLTKENKVLLQICEGRVNIAPCIIDLADVVQGKLFSFFISLRSFICAFSGSCPLIS